MGTHIKKSTKSGFTLIEVVLFLAISSAVLIAILAGTSRSLSQQRYNDTVQDIYSFLQSQYYEVISPQNTGGDGFSKRVIYGKLIVFDKSKTSGSGGSVINAWTVVGDIVTKETQDKSFDDLNLAVKCDEKASYSVQWGGKIETTSAHSDSNGLNASIAILRSPKSGTIYTYRSGSVVLNADGCTSGEKALATGGYGDKFSNKFNSTADTDLCIYTEDGAYGNKRRNIRIKNANSINSIILVPLDEAISEIDPAGGNKCS